MSGVITPPQQDAVTPARPDRSVPLLIGAAVLLIGVVGAVVVIGVNRPPALATLADEPDPAVTGEVAWAGWTGERNCLWVAQVDGHVRDLRCGDLEGDLVGWTEDGLMITRWDGRMLTVDAETGATASRSGTFEPVETVATVVRVERHDGQVLVILETPAGPDVELWRTEAAEAYDVHASSLSPDGDWVALVDSAQRLLVAPADGSAPPRVWASGVDVWHAPVWEGTELN